MAIAARARARRAEPERWPRGLPVPPTVLVGREADVALAQERLLGGAGRLLTPTGPPGVGKTRLALEAAAALHPRFPDGVAFVDLAPVADPARVVPVVADALGLRALADRALLARLVQALQERRVLLVLDNFEHVLPESALPSEARLHDALETHPELFPAEDLNLGQLLVVGREVSFESGAADLIYLDEGGQVVVVEVKRGTENPDSRRVVAQMLDYGAHLWRMSFEHFEARIALPYLRQRRGAAAAPSSLLEVAAEHFTFGETGGPDRFRDALAAHLAAGTFVYAVVARTLPPTLATVLRYLAEVSRIQTAAITVDYFRDDDRHIMVPRIAFASAVQPPVPPPHTSKTTPERFLEEVGAAGSYWGSLLEFLGGLPGKFYWGEKGFSYRLVLDGKQHSVLWGYPRTSSGLMARGSDELIVLVEAPPSRPEQLRRSVERMGPALREQPGAAYKRAGDDQSATVSFSVRDQLAPEADRALRSALSGLFAAPLE